MKKQTKNILAVLGVVSTVAGIIGAIPTSLQEKYGAAAVAGIFVIGGLILLAIAFSD